MLGSSRKIAAAAAAADSPSRSSAVKELFILRQWHAPNTCVELSYRRELPTGKLLKLFKVILPYSNASY